MESTSKAARMQVSNPDQLQLYSIATPNGIKVAACLEELVILKGEEFSYEPHSVDIRHGENRTADFAALNPNQKIPVVVDPHGPHGKEVRVFETGAILLYLADKYDELIPHGGLLRVEVLKWLFWGSVTFSVQVKLFGFYFKYCPHKLPYCVTRYRKAVQRLLVILNNQLAHGKAYLVGDMFTIGDIAVWPWVYALHEVYDNAAQTEFEGYGDLIYLKAWYERCMARNSSKKSLEVCSFV